MLRRLFQRRAEAGNGVVEVAGLAGEGTFGEERFLGRLIHARNFRW